MLNYVTCFTFVSMFLQFYPSLLDFIILTLFNLIPMHMFLLMIIFIICPDDYMHIGKGLNSTYIISIGCFIELFY